MMLFIEYARLQPEGSPSGWPLPDALQAISTKTPNTQLFGHTLHVALAPMLVRHRR